MSITIVAELHITLKGEDYDGYYDNPSNYRHSEVSRVVRYAMSLPKEKVRDRQRLADFVEIVVSQGIKDDKLPTEFVYDRPRRIDDISIEIVNLWRKLDNGLLVPFSLGDEVEIEQDYLNRFLNLL